MLKTSLWLAQDHYRKTENSPVLNKGKNALQQTDEFPKMQFYISLTYINAVIHIQRYIQKPNQQIIFQN